MTDKRDKLYIRFSQGGQNSRTGGSPTSGNWLTRILGLLLLIVIVGLGLAFGLVIAGILVLLMIPVLWRQRHTIKQVWRMRKQAKQHYQSQQRQYEQQESYRQQKNHQSDYSDGSVIDGEYEVKDDDETKR
ncbi:hypothetical protein [Idiomarina piscisalsi]|uniref:DUF2371 domain-containing protein n=1 Tax=Idiomarina piscisalsi TaxID=1096243 RepID=A0ABN5AT49_9GAMM|nr:hypothetical protein [Idiomarina piscisalsi]ASG65897.1 hypothetical protein CEW91_06980 [Idiomarina piscisalsi]MTJ01318.1 hypothetical protein [Idiomarina piscisalsi]